MDLVFRRDGYTATRWWVFSESDHKRVHGFFVHGSHIFDLIWINVIRLRMYYNQKTPVTKQGFKRCSTEQSVTLTILYSL